MDKIMMTENKENSLLSEKIRGVFYIRIKNTDDIAKTIYSYNYMGCEKNGDGYIEVKTKKHYNIDCERLVCLQKRTWDGAKTEITTSSLGREGLIYRKIRVKETPEEILSFFQRNFYSRVAPKPIIYTQGPLSRLAETTRYCYKRLFDKKSTPQP